MDPWNTLAEVAPLFVVFPTIAYIVKMSLDYFTRKKMIEKGLVGPDAINFFKTNAEAFLPSSLKWGMVLTFVGIVIVVLQILPVYISSEVYFGVMLMAAGIAMLIYYGIATIKNREQNKAKPE